jgi:hypothetical protein
MLAAGTSRRCESRLYDPLEFFCSRVELTSVPGGQNAMAHLKKRKLEAESAASKPKQQQQQLVVLSAKKGQIGGAQAIDMETPDAAAKRRRKSVRDDPKSVIEGGCGGVGGGGEAAKNISLPQKKRVFASTNSGSPARKAGKNNYEEPEDDETLIRETEAALKSLSGSWVPGPRGSFYQRGNSDEDRYESNFENLFEEKKDGSKMSPSSMSQSSTTSNETGCSLKDVITLRGQQDRTTRYQQQQSKLMDTYKQHNGGKARKEEENGLLQCQEAFSQSDAAKRLAINRSVAYKNRPAEQLNNRQPDKYSRYEPPDFNELVDESSNELEIDMSDPTVDRNEHEQIQSDDADKERLCKSDTSPSSTKHQQQHQQQHSISNTSISSTSISNTSNTSRISRINRINRTSSRASTQATRDPTPMASRSIPRPRRRPWALPSP